jgi:hypothetical protein
MMAYRLRYSGIILVVILALAAADCGIKGPPLAPLIKTIPPITDLSAVLSGSVVKLSWSPSLSYSDRSELQLRSVYIYRLDQNLVELLKKQAEDAAERKARETAKSVTTSLPPVGEINYMAQKIRTLPIIDFKRQAKLAAKLSVEQLLNLVESGKIRWSEPLLLQPQDLPDSRAIYAVIEEDDRGHTSILSNFAQVIPLTPLPPPTGLSETLSQESLTINWNYPARESKELQQIALVGFNVYKSAEGEPLSSVAVNPAPLPTAAPIEWQPQNLLSQQQIAGKVSRFACLMFTGEAPDAAGISQTLIPTDRIDAYKGTTIRVSLTLSAPGGKARGRIVLDASRDPLKPTEPAAGSQVFGERENPLISITDIESGEEPQRFEAVFRVPSDSRALILKIEPRGADPIAAPFILESVSAICSKGDEELVKNGDFSGFESTAYTETIKKFGGKYSFKVSALYSVSGFQIESETTESRMLEIVDTFPPDEPKNPHALATSDSISVSWNSSRAEDLRGYLVFRREGENGPWKRLTDEPQRGTIYRDTDIKPGVEYSYRIQAIDQAGNRSEFSQIVSTGRSQN